MSGILDVFTTIFRAENSDLDKGLQSSEQKSQELVDRLVDTDKAAGKAGETFKGFAAGALASLTAALSVGALISNAVQSAADIKALAQTADSLNVAIEDLDAFGRAAELAGGDAEGARDSLTDMAEKIGEAFSDAESGASKAFKALGINIKGADGQAKDALTGLLDLAGAVEGMSKSEAIFKIKELGITDNRTVEMVLKGRKELETMLARQKEQGVVTKENAIVAARFTDAMNGLNGSLSRVGMGINTAILPVLTTFVEWLQKIVSWAGEHKDLLVGFFGAIAAVVTAIYLPAMISAAVATLAATWPIIAIVAVIGALAAAFALVYDDIMNFIDGNDSFIGQIFEKYPMVKDIVMSIIDAFRFMGEVIAGVWQMIITGFKQVIDFVGTGVKQIADGIGSVASYFGIGGEDSDKTPKVTGPAAARPSGSGQGPEDVPMIDNPAVANVKAANSAINAANASPLNAATSSSISNSVANNKRETNVQIGEIKVESQATDAQGVANDIGGALTSNIKQVESEFATGRDR